MCVGKAASRRWATGALVSRGNGLSDRPMSRFDVLHMIKRRAEVAALPYSTCCHTFRATGITTYLQNGGTLEHAQTIANHESPRTTKLYDRTREELSFEEVERIKIKERGPRPLERVTGEHFHICAPVPPLPCRIPDAGDAIT
jgi:integrase